MHIENETEKLYKKLLGQIIEPFQKELLEYMRTEGREDSLRSDSIVPGPSVILTIQKLEELRKIYGSRLTRKTLEKMIENQYFKLDAFEKNRVISTIGDEIKSARDITAITIQDTPGITDSIIRSSVRNALGAFDALKENYFERVTGQIFEGVRNGERYKTIADRIREQTGISKRQAEFYARDGVANTTAQVARQRQTAAGFSGYQWKSMNDAKVRDTHSHNNDEFFSWAEGADNLTKPGARHPGEDYRCRCYAKPVRDLQRAIDRQRESVQSAL